MATDVQNLTFSNNELTHNDVYFPSVVGSSLSKLSPDLVKMLMACNNLYAEDKIRLWFQKFIHDCPDGRATKSKLLTVFKHFYNEKKAGLLVDNAINAFGCSTDPPDQDNSGSIEGWIDTHCFLDFSRYLLTINLICDGDSEDKLKVVTALYLYIRNATSGEDINGEDNDYTRNTMSKDDSVILLESIAILLGVKRFRRNTV